MKQYWIKYSVILIVTALLLPASLWAQQDKEMKEKKELKELKEKKEIKEKNEMEQIIITKKGKGNEKIVVEINGDNITINGKPVDDFKDKEGNVTIRRSRMNGDHDRFMVTPRGGMWNNSDDDNIRYFNMDQNMAMLGVTTEKTDNGVKINSVTKESAAEKIGLKEGDIISKIDDQKISDPDDLSTTIREHKPGDKVKVTYSRDKKEQTATAELTKWKGMNIFSTQPGQNYKFDMGDMNFEKIMPRIQSMPQFRGLGENWNWSGGSPKLGLSVQDTDEGKGVKVIEVDDDSNAAKAGIKEDDIVTEVDGKTINGTDDMVKMVRESKDKTSIMVKLQRNGKTQNIEVKMPKKIKTAEL